MSMPWFKVYDEAQNDPKLESLTDAQHRVWFRLMCLSNKQEVRGTIVGYDDLDLLAVEVARGDTELLRATLCRLVKLRIVAWSEDNGNRTEFVNFAKRQARKASDDPKAVKARVDRHRMTKRNALSVSNKEEKRAVTRYKSNVTPLEEDKEEDKEKESPPYSPPRQSAPGQANMPPQVQQDIALEKHLLSSAATLFTSGKLTKAHEGVLAAWFTRHKRQLTSEIVASGIEAAATYTEGDSLNYLLVVMEREITDPGRGKPAKANGKARDGTPNLKAPVPPTGYSWEQDAQGQWKAHEWSEDTQSYPYGCATVGEALNITAEKRQEYIRHRETGKGRGAAA